MNKTQLIEKYKDLHKHVIRERVKWLKDAREAYTYADDLDVLPNLPEPSKCHFSEKCVHLYYPYDRNLIYGIRDSMSDFILVWEVTEAEINNESGNPKLQYSVGENEISVYFIFDDGIEGSTCHRKQIGKEMKEVPVFEWTCEDAE